MCILYSVLKRRPKLKICLVLLLKILVRYIERPDQSRMISDIADEEWIDFITYRFTL